MIVAKFVCGLKKPLGYIGHEKGGEKGRGVYLRRINEIKPTHTE
jgi:hypothetical protein